MRPCCPSPSWQLPGRGGLEVATFGPRSDEIRAWIAKRAARRLYLLTAQASAPLAGRAISESDLVHTRVAAIAVPRRASRALDAFRPAPSIIAETPKGLCCRLAPAQSSLTGEGARAGDRRSRRSLAVRRLSTFSRCRVAAASGSCKHLKGPHHWTLVTAFDAALGNDRTEETAASEPLFAPAASFEMEATDWLWPNVIACGDLTLLGGAPGMGKSQVAIYAAATVSRGGTWPDGSRAQRGSVILCETEDRPGSALRPRLEAAGADLARVSFGQHMDLSADMNALARQAERLPDLRLLVLSPVLTFFGATRRTMTTRCAPSCGPLLEWAASRNVAVLGIIHPLKGRLG